MSWLLTKWFGSVLVDGGRVTQRSDFPRDAHAIAERVLRARQGGILDEERALGKAKPDVAEERLRPLGHFSPPAPNAPVDSGGADVKLLREAALLVARAESRKSAEEPDRFVVQSVRALDELNKTANTLMERLREWYGLHFPEVIRRVPDPLKLVQILAEAPGRDDVAKTVGQIVGSDSIGADFGPSELTAVQGFSRSLQGLFAERGRLEAIIEADARKVAPTLCGLVGPLVAARLIAQANGLERLAILPSSTVQTLGAENALFLHLKEDKRPPKHGILFQHALVHASPPPIRGRIARVMAGLASRAARLDHFGATKLDRSAELKAELDARVAKIRAAPLRARVRPGPRAPSRPMAKSQRGFGRRR